MKRLLTSLVLALGTAGALLQPATADAATVSGGCTPAGTVHGIANYRCTIYTPGGAPTQRLARNGVGVWYITGTVGHMPAGTNGFYCQSQREGASVYLPNGAKNNWWLVPSGNYPGLLNAVYISGGRNFEPVPGLPKC